jgi:hypothetical protein
MSEQILPPIKENFWLGMHSDERIKAPPGLVQLAKNFLLRFGRWVPRDGFVRMTGGSAPTGVGTCQGIYNFQELDGTLHTLAFANADMYEYNWGAGTWSVVDLAAQGITVSPSAKLSFANSRGRLIVTDGVNKPWMWDGASTYTSLAAAPIAGNVVIYYDRVFFFDATASNIKFEWSAPADPTTGYDAAGNSWEFVQTDAGPVRGMAALNNTLVILKEDSAAFLRGSVEDTFETDAVREGLSESEGTISGHSVVVLDGDVFLLSQNGPRRIVEGQRMYNIAHDENENDRLQDFWATVDRSEWSNAHGWVDTQKRLIWWMVPITGQSGLRTALVLDVDLNAFFTYEFGAGVDITAGAQVEDNAGDEKILIGRDNGNVLQQTVGENQDDSVTHERLLRSTQYGLDEPMILNRLAEVRLDLELEADITFQLRAYTDGTVQAASDTGVTFTSGLHRYRKAFGTDTGYGVGWEFRQSADEPGPIIKSALTFLTMSGSYPTLG